MHADICIYTTKYIDFLWMNTTTQRTISTHTHKHHIYELPRRAAPFMYRMYTRWKSGNHWFFFIIYYYFWKEKCIYHIEIIIDQYNCLLFVMCVRVHCYNRWTSISRWVIHVLFLFLLFSFYLPTVLYFENADDRSARKKNTHKNACPDGERLIIIIN